MYAPGSPKITIRLPCVASATDTLCGRDGARLAELGGLGQGGVGDAVADLDHGGGSFSLGRRRAEPTATPHLGECDHAPYADSMTTRWVAAGLCLGVVACAANQAEDRQVFFYQGPDRPGGEEIEGPAPPSDYKFGPSESPTASKRVLDTNGDQRGDLVEYLSNGEVYGSAQDSNFDGKVDV